MISGINSWINISIMFDNLVIYIHILAYDHFFKKTIRSKCICFL